MFAHIGDDCYCGEDDLPPGLTLGDVHEIIKRDICLNGDYHYKFVSDKTKEVISEGEAGNIALNEYIRFNDYFSYECDLDDVKEITISVKRDTDLIDVALYDEFLRG